MEPTQISVADLHHVVREATRSLGYPDQDAETVTEVIVDADLHGVHSHGVRLLATHIGQMDGGIINVTAHPKVVVDNRAAVVVDGDHGYGPVVCHFATDLVFARAREFGVSAVAARNSAHWGCPSYYGRRAAAEGLVLIGASITGAAMPLWGAGVKSVGNNPVVIAVPRRDGEPWVLDISMQAAAWGKLAVYRDSGKRLPGQWGYDGERRLTDDPGSIIASGLIRPMGDHKGSGLAVMVEALTAGLAASLNSREVREQLDAGVHQYKSHLFVAFDPALFGGVEAFERLTADFTARTAELHPVDGFESVQLPGAGAAARRRRIEAEGVPLTPTVRKALDALKARIARAS